MKPVEVAVIAGTFNYGGVEEVVMSYAEAIDTDRVHFTLFVHDTSRWLREERVKACGADMILIPSYWKPIAYQKALGKLFREKRYDIVHSHVDRMSVFPLFAAWRAGIPVRISHSHTTTEKCRTAKDYFRKICATFSKMLATEFCACSDLAGKDFYGKHSSYTVMPCATAYNRDKYLFDAAVRSEKRTELGIKENEIVLGHVGRFTGFKNHSFLVDVFAEMLKKTNTAKLLLVGDGTLLESTKEKVHQLGIEESVIFTGKRTDVNQLYQAMDAFLFPSLIGEGNPLTAMEAQYAGLPCLISENVTHEVVQNEKLVRFLSPDESAELWAETALEMLQNAEARDSRSCCRGRTTAENELPPEELTDWYCALAKSREDL